MMHSALKPEVSASVAVSTATDEADLQSKINSSTGDQLILIPEGANWTTHVNATTTHTNSGWVTIASENPANPSIIRSLTIENTNKIRIRGIRFGGGSGPASGVSQCLLIRDCDDVRVEYNTFEGNKTNYAPTDPGNHNGDVYRGVDRAIIQWNEYKNLYIATQLGGSNDTQYFRNSVFRHNNSHEHITDYLRCYKHTNTEIAYNWLHDPLGVDQGIPLHGDFIQFGNANNVTSEDVWIHHNIIDVG
jgi:hypothetical protein